jgi:hypothetical protein
LVGWFKNRNWVWEGGADAVGFWALAGWCGCRGGTRRWALGFVMAGRCCLGQRRLKRASGENHAPNQILANSRRRIWRGFGDLVESNGGRCGRRTGITRGVGLEPIKPEDLGKTEGRIRRVGSFCRRSQPSRPTHWQCRGKRIIPGSGPRVAATRHHVSTTPLFRCFLASRCNFAAEQYTYSVPLSSVLVLIWSI